MQQQRRILRQQRPLFSMSNAALKYLGWMCTLAGTAAITLYPADDISTMRMILLLTSYVALPIFAFLTMEGVFHTSSCRKYVLTTLIAAVIAEPFYDYVRTGQWFVFDGESAQNVLFSIAITQVMVYFLKRTEQGKMWGVVLKVMLIVAGLFWTSLARSQYGTALIFFAAICYLCREKKFLRGALIIVLSVYTYYTPVLAIFFINRYDGERGRYNKYLFYVLYPAMWILIAVLKLFGI